MYEIKIKKLFLEIVMFMLQRSWYVTEACLMKLLLRLNDPTCVHQDQPLITKLLDMMWALMQVGN